MTMEDLLIVPYGIEIGCESRGFFYVLILLIVPYGIEIRCVCVRMAGRTGTFNRTLWN